MSNQKWSLIRVGIVDYAKGKKGPLYKEILECARRNLASSASVFKSIDGFQIKGHQESVRLFGGLERSQALLFEILIKSEIKEDFLDRLREICESAEDPAIISISNANIEVFGME